MLYTKVGVFKNPNACAPLGLSFARTRNWVRAEELVRQGAVSCLPDEKQKLLEGYPLQTEYKGRGGNGDLHDAY